jgi:hypothetical protein
MLMDIEPTEPRKTGHHKLDLILGGSAVFLSLVSLGVAVLHGHTMERMAEANAQLVQANSWPFLQTESGNQSGSGEQKITLTVSNSGVGPAKIYAARVLYKGETVQNWDTFLADCCSTPGEAALPYSAAIASPVVLRAGDSVNLLSVPHPGGGSQAWDKLNIERGNISFEFCYCSVFDDCWQTDGRSLQPRPVDSCPGASEVVSERR